MYSAVIDSTARAGSRCVRFYPRGLRHALTTGAAEVPHGRGSIMSDNSQLARADMEKAIHAFLATYPAKSMDDVARRLALFVDDAVFEDPVGGVPMRGKGELTEFFKGALSVGIVINMRSEKIIVCGNEAISFTQASWGPEGVPPARYRIVHNFIFDNGGRIRQLRIFFDEGCAF
jgi:ketosteroid isomerase-like protein